MSPLPEEAVRRFPSVVHFYGTDRECRVAFPSRVHNEGEHRDLAVVTAYGEVERQTAVLYDAGPDPEPWTWHREDACPETAARETTRRTRSVLAEALETERVTRSWGIAPGQRAFTPEPGSLYGIEARLNTIGQRIGSGTGSGEPGIIAQLARMEALQAVAARQVEEIHRTLGLERDEDGTPAPPAPLTGEQQDILNALTGRDPGFPEVQPYDGGELPGRVIFLGQPGAGSSAGLNHAAHTVTAADPVWVTSRDGESGHGVVLAVIIPAQDWHEPGTCCCKNCPWDSKHETR